MMTHSAFLPAGDLACLLAKAGRQLGVRCTTGHVRGLFQAHASSLLALTELAPSLGLKVFTGKAELQTLGELDAGELPVLLHFQSGADGGFALLEGVGPKGYRLWDQHHGSRWLDQDRFARLWSGVLVLFEKTGDFTERGYGARRLREWLFEEGHLTTELGGLAPSQPVRALLAILLTTLLGRAVIDPAGGIVWLAAAVALLCVAGALACWAAISMSVHGGQSILCASKRFNCQNVLNSIYARVLGIPLANIGLALFGALLLGMATSALHHDLVPFWVAAATFTAGIPVSVALSLLQIRLRSVCTLCVTVHGLVLLGAITFLLMLHHLPTTPGIPDIVIALCLQSFFFVLLLSSVTPYLERSAAQEAQLADYAALLRSPLATLAQTLARPALPVQGADVGITLNSAVGAPTMVVLAHPSCTLCGPFIDQLELLLQQDPRVNVTLGIAPLDPDDPIDQELAEAIIAAGLALGASGCLQAFQIAKANFPLLRQGDPGCFLAAALQVDYALLSRHFPAARVLIARALDCTNKYADGIPAVFFQDRHCPAPMAHIATWLAQPALRTFVVASESVQQATP